MPRSCDFSLAVVRALPGRDSFMLAFVNWKRKSVSFCPSNIENIPISEVAFNAASKSYSPALENMRNWLAAKIKRPESTQVVLESASKQLRDSAELAILTMLAKEGYCQFQLSVNEEDLSVTFGRIPFSVQDLRKGKEALLLHPRICRSYADIVLRSFPTVEARVVSAIWISSQFRLYEFLNSSGTVFSSHDMRKFLLDPGAACPRLLNENEILMLSATKRTVFDELDEIPFEYARVLMRLTQIDDVSLRIAVLAVCKAWRMRLHRIPVDGISDNAFNSLEENVAFDPEEQPQSWLSKSLRPNA